MKKNNLNKKKTGAKFVFDKFANFVFNLLRSNKLTFLIVSIYVLLMLSVLDWGIPNPSHPFNYHMDEWHQLQAVKSVFKHGTPNVEGSANGTLFHFLLTGIYLIPFILLKIIDPPAISSAVDNLDLQQRLFEVLRLNTLIFGVLSLIFSGIIAKRFLNISSTLVIFFFAFTPIFLSLSNYFKYDIALIFWILFSFFWIFLYAEKQRPLFFYLAGIVSGLTLSTKISALPMILLFPVAFFFFCRNLRKNIKTFFVGIALFVMTFLLLGIPDLLFGKGNLLQDFFYNILVLPGKTNNFILPKPYWKFMVEIIFPSLFGKVLSVFLLISFVYIVQRLIFKKRLDKKKIINKYMIFIIFSFIIFLMSIIPLQYYAGSNRILVLLPFITLIVGYTLTAVKKKFPKKAFAIVILLLFLQFAESISWVSLKLFEGPEKKMSSWIVENVDKGSTIGLENIPLYQLYPDLILKEFYFNQYKKIYKYRYKYEIVSDRSKSYPTYVLLSNDSSSIKYLKASDKNDLARRLFQLGYRREVVFTPDHRFYKYFGTPMHYFFATIVASPTELSLYKKYTSGSFNNHQL